jgi:hypothetical protein
MIARILSLFRPRPAYPVAKARYDDAKSRGDTRAMSEAWGAMFRARNADLRAGR